MKIVYIGMNADLNIYDIENIFRKNFNVMQ